MPKKKTKVEKSFEKYLKFRKKFGKIDDEGRLQYLFCLLEETKEQARIKPWVKGSIPIIKRYIEEVRLKSIAPRSNSPSASANAEDLICVKLNLNGGLPAGCNSTEARIN